MNKVCFAVTTILLLLEFACAPSKRLSLTKSWYKQNPSPISADSTLKGKTIILDPGHGNRTSGSIGLYGTKERDINLAVAYSLRKLLEEHGAIVLMTRASDTTALWPSGISAREDLRFRCHFRDSVQPDLFISLHHNGSEDGSRDVNNAKTFYALGDEGGSLDIASCINNEFTKRLGLGASTLNKGNYFILRNAEVPSIIGEPSYLSHPVMEKILQDSAAISLEAVTYFKGIVSWFSQGVPKITDMKVEPMQSNITATIQSEYPLDSMLTGTMFDDKKLIGRINSGGVTAALPFPLKNGVHTITCFCGNINGNLGTRKSIKLEVNRKPASLHFSYEKIQSGPVVPIYITVLDSLGLSVKDGTVVTCNKNDTVTITDGNAIYYHNVTGGCDSVRFSCDSISQQITICACAEKMKPFQGYVKSISTSFKAAYCTIEIGGNLFSTDRNGFFSFNSEDTTVQKIAISASAKGFIDTNVMMQRGFIDTIKLSPRASGILFGKKIMIDAEFGGYESGGVNSNGMRGCDITRKISTCIASQLEQDGACVFLARSEDNTVNVTERVFSAQKNNVDFYILVRSDSMKNDPYLMYSPGSEKGKLAAECFVKCWKRESKRSAKVIAKIEYVLQQTECPAVGFSLCPIGLKESSDPQRWHLIARTVVDGLIDYFGSLESSIH
jgi:N-acetylmuramoyl-L-alanine amidase